MRRWLLLSLLVAGLAFGAVDTRDKRASALNVGGIVQVMPDPDGTIDAADRLHIAGEYRGIAASPPPVGGPTSTQGSKKGLFGLGLTG